jgi:Polysulphide reductase, NrfD
MVEPAAPASYYGRPVLKAPVWSEEIPWYFFAGGMAGASAPLALAASLAHNRPLARAASAVALAGVAVSPPLLISDLGRPERFLNMLRVFKPTSPMNMGTWILTAFGPAAALGAGREMLGLLPRAGRAGQVGAAVLGPVLSTYTAVLLANTAVPVWHEARRELPFVFAGGSMASAGAAALALTPARSAGPARRLAVGGVLLTGAAAQRMERRLGPLGGPYREGRPARLRTAAQRLSLAGAALAGLGRGRPAVGRAGAALMLAGVASERRMVFSAGSPSARDPAYTVGPQRRRLARRQRSEARLQAAAETSSRGGC